MKCGATDADSVIICADHIKSRKLHKRLRLKFRNLQILCDPCNKSKGWRDKTDYRPLMVRLKFWWYRVRSILSLLSVALLSILTAGCFILATQSVYTDQDGLILVEMNVGWLLSWWDYILQLFYAWV